MTGTNTPLINTQANPGALARAYVTAQEIIRRGSPGQRQEAKKALVSIRMIADLSRTCIEKQLAEQKQSPHA